MRRAAAVDSNQRAIAFTVPIRTVSLSNQREHWAVRAKRVKRERLAVFAAFPWRRELVAAQVMGELKHGLRVKMTRVSPRKVDDDNLRGCLKGTRDEIARLLGVDDGDERATWEYAQRKGKACVEVEIRSD